MRTTVTLDRDTEQLLRDAMQRTRRSFKVTLNQAIRKGLGGEEAGSDEGPYRVQARALGFRAELDRSRLNQLDDELDVDAFLETTRRLQGRGESAP